MQSLIKNNAVDLCGQVISNPKLGHIINDEKFYSFFLNIKRQSQKFDTLFIIAPFKFIEILDINPGDFLKIEGQFRSYNNKSYEGKKLELFIFAKEIEKLQDELYLNTADMNGYICKNVIFRSTPKGKKIADMLIALNRGYYKSDYIPAIAWGKNAYVASTLLVGDKVNIKGRIQSRTYNKIIDNKHVLMTAYEMSVSQIEKSD